MVERRHPGSDNLRHPLRRLPRPHRRKPSPHPRPVRSRHDRSIIRSITMIVWPRRPGSPQSRPHTGAGCRVDPRKRSASPYPRDNPPMTDAPLCKINECHPQLPVDNGQTRPLRYSKFDLTPSAISRNIRRISHTSRTSPFTTTTARIRSIRHQCENFQFSYPGASRHPSTRQDIARSPFRMKPAHAHQFRSPAMPPRRA